MKETFSWRIKQMRDKAQRKQDDATTYSSAYWEGYIHALEAVLTILGEEKSALKNQFTRVINESL